MQQRSFQLIIWILVLIDSMVYCQSISRVEPPSWWVGMHDESLQIMIYGKSIGHLQASVKNRGVKVIKTTCPGNQNYLFIDLSINKKTKSDTVIISLMNGKEKALEVKYSLLKRESGSADRKGYKTEDVIYLITPDRFANGDPSNDDVEEMKEKVNRTEKNGRHGGDIEGMRQHLDYISAMGFTAIWPNPVIENNMTRYSYHGYAITDFYRVDARMGTNNSFRDFCNEANQKGIKVIMDMILNHCGSEHWWMRDPPTHDWINYYNQPYVETNHKKTLHTDPYMAQEDKKVLEDGWFVRTMPDMNVRNPWLAKYLIQNSIWWIEYAGLAGIRMDTYLYPDEKFMTEWAKSVMNEYPDFNITGEVWFDNPAVLSYWQKGKNNPNGYVSHLPSLFDFPLHYALRKSLMSSDGFESGWHFLHEMLGQDFLYPNPMQLVTFPDNHDMTRIFTQLEENIPKLKMALAHVLTVRGIPQIYYGTEILKTSPPNRDDGMIRSDFPGGWEGDEINAFTGEGLTAEQIEIQRFVKRILKWRKESPAIHHGQTTHFVPQNGIYVMFRYTAEQKVMIILNKNENNTTLELDRYKRLIGKTLDGYDIINEKNIDFRSDIYLTSPGPMIIEFN